MEVLRLLAGIRPHQYEELLFLLVMLFTYGALRPGALRLKLGACALAGLIVVAFLATPTGAKRIENESSTSISSSLPIG